MQPKTPFDLIVLIASVLFLGLCGVTLATVFMAGLLTLFT